MSDQAKIITTLNDKLDELKQRSDSLALEVPKTGFNTTSLDLIQADLDNLKTSIKEHTLEEQKQTEAEKEWQKSVITELQAIEEAAKTPISSIEKMTIQLVAIGQIIQLPTYFSGTAQARPEWHTTETLWTSIKYWEWRLRFWIRWIRIERQSSGCSPGVLQQRQW